MTARRPLRVTRFQALYLRELVTDDLEVTDLRNNERQAARALVERTEELLEDWIDFALCDCGAGRVALDRHKPYCAIFEEAQG